MKLYEISTAIEAIVAETEDGELSPDAEARLDALQMDLADKADNVAALIRQMTLEAASYQAESARLDRLAYQADTKAQRLKDYLHRCLSQAGVTKLACSRFKMAVCRNGVPSVVIDDPEQLPDAYKTAVTKTVIDKTAIIRDHKAGAELPPGVTLNYGTHLRIN